MTQLTLPWGGALSGPAVPDPNAPPPALWPHQARAVRLVAAAYRQGHRAVLLTLPTGGGKSRVIAEMCASAAAKGRRSGVFTHRKILTGQAGRTLDRQGVPHGYLAAGWHCEGLHDVQVMSLQTVGSRYARGALELPDFDIVHIDEAHSQKAETAQALIGHYRDRGALVIGWTATPLGLSGLYTTLLTAGTPSELRACGALVPCEVYAPDEPDLKGVRCKRDGEYVAAQATKRAMETIVFGDVFDHWARLNPWRLPTLLWAPGVRESAWFAAQFRARGVNAAHIDGDTPDPQRREHFVASLAGDLPVICSCGVLREGVDLPWIAHGILVQPCGALTTYLQLAGRLLRAHPGKTHATLQDHAGAWHRHGDPNADRQWDLADDDRKLNARRKEPKPPGDPPDPVRCPECSFVRQGGPACPACGHRHKKSVRMVRMTGGKLVRVVGDAVKRRKEIPAELKTWTACLYAAAASGQTVAQAAGNYRRQTGSALPAGLPHVPAEGSQDWKRCVSDVYPWFKRRSKP